MIQIIFVTRAATYEKPVEEHKHSVIGKHFDDERDLRPLKVRPNANFFFFYKCRRKLVCLIFENLLMRKKRPKLNTQSDFIRLKIFGWRVMSYYFSIQILAIHAHTFSVNAMSSMHIIDIIADNFAQ